MTTMARVPASTPTNDMLAGQFKWLPPRNEGEEDRILFVALPVMCDWSQVEGWQDKQVDLWHAALPVRKGEHLDVGKLPVWEWDGSPGSPTLNPSVRVSTEGGDGQKVDVWHGYIQNGMLVFLDASPQKALDPEVAAVAGPEPEPEGAPPLMTVRDLVAHLVQQDLDQPVVIDVGTDMTWAVEGVRAREDGAVLITAD